MMENIGWKNDLLVPCQVHGSKALIVTNATEIQGAEGDALVTSAQGVLLGVLVADCVPVLFCDASGSVVGCAHAGWRGTAQGISAKAVEMAMELAGIGPDKMRVAIGPAIGPCCYGVDKPVAAALAQSCPGGIGTREGVDLQEINRRQLIALGVDEDRIESIRLCTSCRKDLFFSFRRDRGQTGRMVGYIGIVA